MTVWDANALFGFSLTDNRDMSPEALLIVMDRAGIERAVIANTECMFRDFRAANEETAKVVRAHPDRFIGFLGFNPARYWDVADEVDRGLDQLGLSGIRLFNTAASFTSGWGVGLDSAVLASAMERASAHRAVVFLEAGYPFQEVARFASTYPDIRVIACGAGYGNAGEAIMAARAVTNLWLDLTTMDIQDGVDLLVTEVGAGKIVYGSGLPLNSPSSVKMMVEHARISEDDRAAILGGNLRQLLEGKQ